MAVCVERKRRLGGRESLYECELIYYETGFCILKYIIDKHVQVGSVQLRGGTVTYGFFWSDRPYTLYKWISKEGVEIANYFNVADSVSITKTEVRWRDLILDILVTQDGIVEVLDEDELRRVSDEALLAAIERGKREILSSHPDVVRMTTVRLKQIVPE